MLVIDWLRINRTATTFGNFRSNKEPLVLEVDSSPRLEGIEQVSWKDIAGMIIPSIGRQLNWQRDLEINGDVLK